MKFFFSDIEITPLESQGLILLAENAIDCAGRDFGFTDEANSGPNKMKKESFSGIVSNLVQKGLVDVDTEGYDTIVGVKKNGGLKKINISGQFTLSEEAWFMYEYLTARKDMKDETFKEYLRLNKEFDKAYQAYSNLFNKEPRDQAAIKKAEEKKQAACKAYIDFYKNNIEPEKNKETAPNDEPATVSQPIENKLEEIMSVERYSKENNISSKKVRKLIRQGKIKAVKFNKKWGIEV